MTRAAIFDLDGTLIDTPNAIVTMMVNALTDMGAPLPDEEDIRSMIGLPLEAGAAHVLGKSPDHPDVAQLISLYRLQFLDWMVPRSAELLFPGVPEGLHTLREAGILLGLATSKYNRSADAVLRAAGLRDLFAVVAGSDDVISPKPDAEMAHLVADRLGVAPRSCVVIGDTVHDLHMARAAGMRRIAVTYGVGSPADLTGAAPDRVVDTFPAAVSAILAPPTTSRDAA